MVFPILENIGNTFVNFMEAQVLFSAIFFTIAFGLGLAFKKSNVLFLSCCVVCFKPHKYGPGMFMR
jgi:hypothetical protein